MFDSLNIYESLAVIVADSPQALVAELKAIKTPIKIISIVQIGLKSAAYISGDIRVKTKSADEKPVDEKPTNKKVK